MKTNQTEYLETFTIGKLFSNNDQYLIPVYQRNYEWGKAQIEQLLLDIKDYFLEQNDKNYYTGTLIVDKRTYNNTVHYEAIDGQQRLTTFNIICCALKEMEHNIEAYFKQPILHFESRPNADAIIKHIFEYGIQDPPFPEYNVAIHDGIKIAKQKLLDFKKELKDAAFNDFVQYLFEKVILLRVQVPKDTDMNHYFEIMNSRGEQLEKHEVLKSRLMAKLNHLEEADQLRKVFHTIWEACADMHNHVQLNFVKDKRKELFGASWYSFMPQNFEEVYAILQSKETHSIDNTGIHFNDILQSSQTDLDAKLAQLHNEDTVLVDKDPGKFQPVINFENFLLHVLKIMEADQDGIKEEKDSVSLDDKRLLLFFENILKEKANQNQEAEFVKEFAYQLLKTRMLLDNFVLKRKYAGDTNFWSLQIVNYYPKEEDGRQQDSFSFVNTFEENNKELLMLLAMFHVSTPTLVYKNWLFGVLYYLVHHTNTDQEPENKKTTLIKSAEYLAYLRTMAVNFMKYRHLTQQKLSYDRIILSKEKLPHITENQEVAKFLSYGNIDSNLVFNYTDYLLWKTMDGFNDFEFSFRSSVEHYYPQNPITGEKLQDKTALNCFGNLCLISHGNNSRLSNHLPKAKKDYYKDAPTKDSIKQMLMMEKENWGVKEINEHKDQMTDLLHENVYRVFLKEKEL